MRNDEMFAKCSRFMVVTANQILAEKRLLSSTITRLKILENAFISTTTNQRKRKHEEITDETGEVSCKHCYDVMSIKKIIGHQNNCAHNPD